MGPKEQTVDKPTADDLDVSVEVHRTGNETNTGDFEEPNEDEMEDDEADEDD